ncbi:MAG: hypothetical protein U5L04_16040 [Trueperaceae bacterium]|nr:hypothetical protein [Trueperaceae bacterium]
MAWRNWLAQLRNIWHESSPTAQWVARGVLVVVVLAVGFQTVRWALTGREVSQDELRQLEFYAESVHNVAIFSRSREGSSPVPTGNCLSGYTTSTTTVEPDDALRRYMASCQVSLDNNGLPVVTVTHERGVSVRVP